MERLVNENGPLKIYALVSCSCSGNGASPRNITSNNNDIISMPSIVKIPVAKKQS